MAKFTTSKAPAYHFDRLALIVYMTHTQCVELYQWSGNIFTEEIKTVLIIAFSTVPFAISVLDKYDSDSQTTEHADL